MVMLLHRTELKAAMSHTCKFRSQLAGIIWKSQAGHEAEDKSNRDPADYITSKRKSPAELGSEAVPLLRYPQNPKAMIIRHSNHEKQRAFQSSVNTGGITGHQKSCWCKQLCLAGSGA